MKKIYKLILLLIITVLAGFLYSFLYNPSVDADKVDKALKYCRQNGMNTDVIMFCDFSKHSGTRRFLVYDTRRRKVILSSLCEQGKGKGFSNKPGSNCSSLGYFKVCYPHKMRIGLSSYVLQGLSATNSNAKSRGILIHPYYTVSELPTCPLPIVFKSSKGCFILSPIKYKVLRRIIQRNSGKPILLYAYV